MQRINIIPTKLKKEIKMRKIYNSVRKLFLMLLIFTSFNAIVLVLAEVVLKTHLADTNNQSKLITTSTKDYVQKVKEINEQVTQIAEIQNNNVAWSNLLQYLSNNSQENNIEFNKISIDQTKNSLTLNGKCKTRKDLLAFKSSIESNKNFSNINFPIKNLLEKENIIFDISFNINNYDFSDF